MRRANFASMSPIAVAAVVLSLSACVETPPGYYSSAAPQPSSAAPPSTPAPPPVPECREMHLSVMIGNQPQDVVGTACRQPDGTWRIRN